jgi:hypothetical protein
VTVILTVRMSTIVRIAIIVHLAQAAPGFAVGFSLPWLQFFGVRIDMLTGAGAGWPTESSAQEGQECRCSRSRLIKSTDRVSERPPQSGPSFCV